MVCSAQAFKTADPNVLIEERRPGFVRYRHLLTGRRWEVHGVCDRRGDCLVGAVIDTPDGPVLIRSHEHISELQATLGRARVDSELDVPVTPEFDTCCAAAGLLTFKEL